MAGENTQGTVILKINTRSRTAWEGCSVLLDVNDGDRFVFARLTPNSMIKVGNQNYSLQPLIGCPFGSRFQVEVGAEGPYLSRVTNSSAEGNSTDEQSEKASMEEQRDNRDIVDNNTAQNLTGQDIDDMRRKGATGDQIVGALISNSVTFDKKTAFSQEKYRIKKQKKYAPSILLRRPFARSICEAYFKKHAERIGYLRVDTLSLLLSMANISANSDILLVDMLEGLITGAVAERMGGLGYVCNTYCGTTPYLSGIVRMFNFSDEMCQRIVHCSLDELRSSEDAVSESADKFENVCHSESEPNGAIQCPSSAMGTAVDDINGDAYQARDATAHIKESKSVKSGGKAAPELIKSWREKGFSSLIVAAPNSDAWEIVKEVVPLLSHSATFVVYHQYLEPLATCMHNLQMDKVAIGLQISEPWLREYQVLPSRSHPCMQMSSSGGYLLSGTRICRIGAE